MVYSVLSYLRLTSFKILNDVTFGAIFNTKKKKKKKVAFHFKWNGEGILSTHDFYASIVIDCKSLMSLIYYLELLHCYHEGNQTTDFLAKLGYS